MVNTAKKVVTRFAPSPTGYLHIGSARTALFSWLYARHHQGTFILRIEDTDLERSTPEAVQVILEGMRWLGLDWDDGPFYQTQRFDRYKAVAQEWVEKGLAYRCHCTRERLEALRTSQMANKEKARYDHHCRDKNLGADQPHVIRFRNPLEGTVVVADAVKGEVVFSNKELDDLIIVRSDGAPTYNFTVVIDDWEMGVTHVIRGDDHLNNTPRQINMLKALGAELPIYAHIPMILGGDGKKLSKRQGAVNLMQYQDQGYLPITLLNYLVRLGWSHKDQEIFSLEEMVQYFTLDNLSKSPAMFNPEKMLWLNQHYLKTLSLEDLKPYLEWQLQHLLPNVQCSDQDWNALLQAQKERSKTLVELIDKSHFYWESTYVQDEESLIASYKSGSEIALKDFVRQLQNCTVWEADTLHTILKNVVEQHGLKLGDVAPFIRIGITGSKVSPPIDVTLAMLGQNRSLARLQKALDSVGVKL